MRAAAAWTYLVEIFPAGKIAKQYTIIRFRCAKLCAICAKKTLKIWFFFQLLVIFGVAKSGLNKRKVPILGTFQGGRSGEVRTL